MEVITLDQIAAVGTQLALLRPRFHPFRHQLQTQRTGDADHRTDDGPAFLTPFNAVDKGTIDFQDIDRQTGQLRQRGIAGAEIIDGNPQAEIGQPPQNAQIGLDIGHQRSFSDLQQQPRRLGTRFLQNGTEIFDQRSFTELTRGHIDGNIRRLIAPTIPPLRLGPAGLAEDPEADGHNGTGQLGNRNEDGGRHLAAGRRPAQQQLGTCNTAAFSTDNRLKAHGKFIPLDRLPQPIGDRQPLLRLRLQALIEELPAIAATFLDRIHRGIGIAQQIIRRMRTAISNRHPDTARHEQIVALKHDRLPQYVVDPRRQQGHADRLLDLLAQGDEFIAGQPANGIARPYLLDQASGNGLQEQIPDLMTIGVIDQLEAIQIDEQQGHIQTAAPRTLQGLRQALADQDPVRQSGQRVMGRPAGEFFLRPLALGNVAQGHHQQPVVTIAEFGNRGFERKESAILAVTDHIIAAAHFPFLLVTLNKCSEQFGMPLAKMRRQQQMDRHAKQFLPLIAEQGLGATIGFSDDTATIRGDDCHISHRQNVLRIFMAHPALPHLHYQSCRRYRRSRRFGAGNCLGMPLVAFGNLRRNTAKALHHVKTAVGIAAGQIGIHAGVMGGGVHLDHALRAAHPDLLQRANQGLGGNTAGGLDGAGKRMHAQIGGFTKISQHTIAVRPDARHPRLARQLLQQPVIFRRAQRHEIGAAGIQAFAHRRGQLAHQHFVVMPHHDRHAPLQAALGKARENRQLVAACEIRHKDIGARAGELFQQVFNFILAGTDGQIFLTDHGAFQPLQHPFGGIDGAARPLIVIAGEEHLDAVALRHERNHLVDLLVGQGGKIEEVAATDTPLVKREIQQGDLARRGHLGNHRNPRAGQQIADQRNAAVLIEQSFRRRNSRRGHTAIVLDDQLERPPKQAATLVDFLTGDARRIGDLLPIQTDQTCQGRHQPQADWLNHMRCLWRLEIALLKHTGLPSQPAFRRNRPQNQAPTPCKLADRRPPPQLCPTQSFELGDIGQHRLDILALLLQRCPTLFHDAQTLDELRRFVFGRSIHADQVLDLGQAQPQALAAQGHFQAGTITAGKHPFIPFPLRRQDALILPETDGARGDGEFTREIGNAEHSARRSHCFSFVSTL